MVRKNGVYRLIEKKLLLASVSPRRSELMAMGGWQFDVLSAGIDEDILPAEKAHSYVVRMAESKARAVAKLAPHHSLVIGADTTVVSPDGEILAKPQNETEALEMLHCLRGLVHQVLTGVVVMQAGNVIIDQDVCVTNVQMRSYTEVEMQDYIASGDPFDKAGGYAIQDEKFDPVKAIDGCFANVVGLPVCSLARLLQKHGVEPTYQLPANNDPSQFNNCPICQQLTRGRK
jgi:septum formation protein